MKAITLKNVPEELLSRLREEARAAHRSLTGEILYRLSQSLETAAGGPGGRVRDAAVQAAAWEELAGNWRSDHTIDEEIAALYEARSEGRDIDVTW